MSEDRADRAAYKAWILAAGMGELTLGSAFQAGFDSARALHAQASETPHANKWREAATAELIALCTIVLQLGSTLWEERRAEAEALEREWHRACLDEDATGRVSPSPARIAESRYKEVKASFEAIERALIVLEAAKDRDKKP